MFDEGHKKESDKYTCLNAWQVRGKVVTTFNSLWYYFSFLSLYNTENVFLCFFPYIYIYIFIFYSVHDVNIERNKNTKWAGLEINNLIRQCCNVTPHTFFVVLIFSSSPMS